MLQYTTAPNPCPMTGWKHPPQCPPHWKLAVWFSVTNHCPLQEWVRVDVFGFPEPIVVFPELVAMMIIAASPMELPMKTIDAIPFEGSLSMSYNWPSTLAQTNVHIRAW